MRVYILSLSDYDSPDEVLGVYVSEEDAQAELAKLQAEDAGLPSHMWRCVAVNAYDTIRQSGWDEIFP
jgi:hypothetical protein